MKAACGSAFELFGSAAHCGLVEGHITSLDEWDKRLFYGKGFLVSSLDRCADRKLNIDGQVFRGGRREESNGYDRDQPEAGNGDDDGDRDCQELVANRPQQHRRVDALDHGLAIGGTRARNLIVVEVAAPQKACCQNRHDCNRHDGGGEQREADGYGERAEEFPYNAGNERERDENDHSSECGGYDRRAHLLGAADGSLVAALAKVNMTVDILQHNDAVVHDTPDGDSETGEGHEVKRDVGGQ